MNRNTIYFFAICSLLAVCCEAQPLRQPLDKYKSGDTIVEVKHLKNLNSIREFREIKGTDTVFFKNYYMDTKHLRETGTFKNGWCIGTWKYYSKSGKLEKEINYQTNKKTLYGKESEPYDATFNMILHHSDSLMIDRCGELFFKDNIILNANRCYYYGAGSPGRWFEVPDYKPKKFLMRYDMVFDDVNRFPFFEFYLDSLGNLEAKSTIERFSNLKQQDFLLLATLDSIALQNGFTPTDKPFSHRLGYKADTSHTEFGSLEVHVIGSPYDRITEGDTTTRHFYYLVMDPWTGAFIRRESGSMVTTGDKNAKSTIVK